jgi:uncharacterized alpha-E superfamily protein
VEHIARYTKVHYYSSLDAPLAQKKEFVLESILNMMGLLHDYKQNNSELVDEEVVHYITIDESNPLSIKSALNNARENARGARDSLSSELWESINKFYHFVNRISKSDLKRQGVFGFAEKIMENCYIVNGNIDNTLLHNEVWSLIHLGIHIERASQITRILISKVDDISKTQKQKLGKAIENYQCITLLKSTEAFDMSRTFYKAVPNLKDTVEFLVLNCDFPRSICYNLSEISKCLHKISQVKIIESDSLEFYVGKICTAYNYLTISEIEDNAVVFLRDTLNKIYNIGEQLEKKYLTF